MGKHHTIQLHALIALLEKAIGKKAIVDRKPMQLGDVEMTCADIQKPARLLGYRPSVDIDTVVERFVDWFREEMGASRIG